MTKTIQIRNIILGEGRPKICVPLVGKDDHELMEEIAHLKDIPYDVIEWRMDHHVEVENRDKMQQTAKLVRKAVGNVPLLATFRTKKEGGEREVATQYYVQLNKCMAQTGEVDMIDVELFTGEDEAKELVSYVHELGVKVVMSNHDFHKTPDQKEIIARLCKMQSLGADFPKIAVMPQNAEDVLVLLAATNEMHTKYADRPIITMSMGKLGLISRLAGEVFGSCLTFGAGENVSAPGQISALQLADILQLMQKS